MKNKLAGKDDHRYKDPPCAGLNIDIVRCLASAPDTAAARLAVSAISDAFGGITYIKALPGLEGPAAAERFHLLPVMLTVLFEPGMTVGALARRPATAAAWNLLRTQRPGQESTEQWQADHDVARQMLLSAACSSLNVVMHCEVQLLTQDAVHIRHQMHELYKIFRAETPKQLFNDVITPRGERPNVGFVVAARDGRVETVRQMLLDTRGGGTLDVNQCGKNGGTALFEACKNGHVSIVHQLLMAEGIDANKTEAQERATPLMKACSKGHRDVVQLLLVRSTCLPCSLLALVYPCHRPLPLFASCPSVLVLTFPFHFFPFHLSVPPRSFFS